MPHQSNSNFASWLGDLGWSDARAAGALETDEQEVFAWRQGHRPVPERIMRAVRTYHEIFYRSSDEARTTAEFSFSPAHREATDQIRDLEHQLAELRRAYRELSAENAALRQRLTDSIGREPSVASVCPDEVLGVAPGEDWGHVRSAFVRLSQRYHPARGGTLEQMQRLSAAYAELKVVYGR